MLTSSSFTPLVVLLAQFLLEHDLAVAVALLCPTLSTAIMRLANGHDGFIAREIESCQRSKQELRCKQR